MIVLGGRTNTVGENVQMEVYETESSEWKKFNSLQRFRHTVWAIDNFVYMHGGFENETPNIPTNSIVKIDLAQLFRTAPALMTKLEQAIGGGRAGSNASSRTGSTSPSDQSRANTPPLQSIAKQNERIRIGRAEVEVAVGEKPKIVALHELEDEKNKGLGRKLPDPYKQKQINSIDTLYSLFLNHLLRPREWSAQFDGNGYFAFRREHIIALADECQKVLEEQPMVLRVDAPIKVFGDIHGQYQDLMRFFDLWGCPSENGDIECFDYLFLGDYVDRGSHSLETICLLMALKVKYPEKIHLLRGNHEDKWINNAFGFAEECSNRLGEDPAEPDSVFNKINDLFDWLPLAALIEDKIVCLHGGIGSTLVSIEQIEQIGRPLEVIHEVSTPE